MGNFGFKKDPAVDLRDQEGEERKIYNSEMIKQLPSLQLIQNFISVENFVSFPCIIKEILELQLK